MVDVHEANVVELYRDVDTYNSAFNHNASDKMQRLGLGELPPPAQCFICGSGSNESGYVLLGVWADYIGNLLMCSSCMVQASELIGCLPPVIKMTMERHIADLQAHCKQLEQQAVIDSEQLASYRSVINYSGSASGVTVPEPSSGDTYDGGPIVIEPATESDNAESVDESGRTNVPKSTKKRSGTKPLIEL